MSVELLSVHDLGDDVLEAVGVALPDGLTSDVVSELLKAAIAGTLDEALVLANEAAETEVKAVLVHAYGHVSATTNHYGPEAYDDDGNLLLKTVKKAPGDPMHEPRAMTPAEVGAYARSLLEAVVPPEPVEPSRVEFK